MDFLASHHFVLMLLAKLHMFYFLFLSDFEREDGTLTLSADHKSVSILVP